MLVADGVFDVHAMLERFPRIARALPREVFDFVGGKLREYAARSPRGR